MNKRKKRLRHQAYIHIYKRMLAGTLGRDMGATVIFNKDVLNHLIRYHEKQLDDKFKNK